jgi:small subunit ribosomal protein S6
MRNYEAIFIFRSEEEQYKQGTSTVENEFKNCGIKLINQESMGKKDLAYDIKKQSEGYYICYKIQSAPDKLKLLEKSLKLRPEILKFVIFKDDKK